MASSLLVCDSVATGGRLAGDIGKILVFFGKYFDQKSAFFLPFLPGIQWDFFGNETKTIFRKKPKFYRYRRPPVLSGRVQVCVWP